MVPLNLARAPRGAGRAGVPAALFATLLLACAAPGPAPQDRFFSLQTQPAPGAPGRQGTPGATLSVQDLSARGFLGGRQIVYRTAAEPLEVRRYPRLLWEEPAGRALAAELATALRAAGPFALVLGRGQGARSDYVLTGELARFEHRPTATPAYVTAELGLTLTRRSDQQVLMSASYAGQEPTGADTAEAMVRAFHRLAGRLIAEAVAEIGRLRPRLRHKESRRP